MQWSHPDQLAQRALLRGIDAAPSERCRVLELACGDASNIAPMAYDLDESEFVGVEEATGEFESAQETKDRLGLDNLKLVKSAPLEAGDELGKFDYIVAHRVVSQLDDASRPGFMQFLRQHLAPQGVAYVGYDCAAGGVITQQIQRAVGLRLAGVEAEEEQVRLIRETLTILLESPLRETPHGVLLATASSQALEQTDAALLREFLSPQGRPLFFSEVVELAAAAELACLAEVSQATGTKGVDDGIRGALVERFADDTLAEELADVMLFRAYRATLFVHDAALAEAGNTDEAARELGARATFAAPLRQESKRLSLEPDINELFVTPQGIKISADRPLLKATLLELGRSWPIGLSFDDICSRAEALLELRRIIGPEAKLATDELQGLLGDLLTLCRLGHLELRVREAAIVPTVTAAPKVSALTRYEAGRGAYVTNAYHQALRIDPFAALLVRHLDGTRNVAVLAQRMIEHLRSGDFSAVGDDGVEPDMEVVEGMMEQRVEETLQLLATSALLVA